MYILTIILLDKLADDTMRGSGIGSDPILTVPNLFDVVPSIYHVH